MLPALRLPRFVRRTGKSPLTQGESARSFVIHRWALVICALALATGSLRPDSAARAQTPGSVAIDFEEALTPDFARHDLPTLRADLRLDPEQTAIVEALITDYSEQFEKALGEVRDDLRAAQSALGFEDPAIEQQREDIQEQIAATLESMQRDLEHPPAGADVNEIREKYQQSLKELDAQLRALQGPVTDASQVAKMFDEASRRLEQWRARKREMREKFETDLQAILRPDQQPLWEPLARKFLRQATLGRGRLQGESLDLTLLVRDARPPLDSAQKEKVAQAMQAYEAQLDAALRARNQLIESSERGLFTAVAAADRAALASIIGRQTQARVAVRDANDQAAAAIASALGGDVGAKFLQSYQRRAYPQVFRDTPTMRLIKAARELPGLTAEQVSALGQLQTAYEQEVAATDEQVLQAVRQHEPALLTLREVHRLLPPKPEDEATERDRGPDGVQEAFARRNAMGQKFEAQLQGILGEEMFERLPRGRGREETPDQPQQPR